MAEREKQFEIQLGHLCNNRCVFCVSGQLTSKGQAPLLSYETLAKRVTEAREAGHRRITLLGGEPTIQPFFLDLVKHTVALGFEEIVIFSNGSKMGRTDLVDRVLQTGGNFEWRFSFQGATKEAHERTTRRKGSWDQLVRSVELVRERGGRVTVNMCIVTQNYESLPHFAELLLPRGVVQLHVDMLNPYDTGVRTFEEISAIMPRLSDLAQPLERMVAGFPDDFDVNVGNLPYCVAPKLLARIHHGGEPTETVTVDDFGGEALLAERNKYPFKQHRKTKPDRCRACVFDDRCSGVFDAYAERFGLDELQPIDGERLLQLDPSRALVGLHVRALLRAALAEGPPAPFERASVVERGLREIGLVLDGSHGQLSLSFRKGVEGIAAAEGFALQVTERTIDGPLALEGLRKLWTRMEHAGMRTVHPPGEDAFGPLRPTVLQRLARLRARAPFGELRWTNLSVQPGGGHAEAAFEVDQERVVVWLAEDRARATGGYRLERSDDQRAPSSALVRGMEQILDALGKLPRQPTSPR